MSRILSYLIKILVSGESAVGKTTLNQRYLSDKFIIGTKSTIGVDFFLKHLKGNYSYLKPEEELVLQLWDMSGESRFRELLPLYSAGTQGVLLCYDTTRPETLFALNEWIHVLNDLIPKDVPKMLIRMKADLQNMVPTDLVEKFVIENQIAGSYHTSAKDGMNVKEVFEGIAYKIFTHLEGKPNI